MSETVRASDYDALDPKVRADPYPYYAAMRRESPLHRMIPGVPLFAVSRYDDVEFVLHHPEVFSSTAPNLSFEGKEIPMLDSLALRGPKSLPLRFEPA